MIKDLGRAFTKKTESEADNLSISTGTAGAHGSKLIAKVEKISRNVHNMIVAKKPLEGLFSVLESAKAAFTNLKHLTLFLVDPALQYFMANMPKHKYKDVPIEGIQSGQIMGVFLEEPDFCAPCFRHLSQASQRHFTNKLISIPVSNEEDRVMFTLQIEADLEKPTGGHAGTKMQKHQSLVSVNKGRDSARGSSGLTF